MLAQGVVKDVIAKPWKDKTLYSFKLSDGNYYSTGVKSPPSTGSSIKFEYSTNSRGYKDVIGTSIVNWQSAGVHDVAVAGNVARSKGLTKDDYWEQKAQRDVETQKRIEIQSCRNSAIAFIAATVAAGAVKLPAKESDKLGVLEEFLTKYTNKYLEENKGAPKTTEASNEVTSESLKDLEDAAEWA